VHSAVTVHGVAAVASKSREKQARTSFTPSKPSEVDHARNPHPSAHDRCFRTVTAEIALFGVGKA